MPLSVAGSPPAPVGCGACRALWHEVTFFTRPIQALHHPAHGRETETHACGVGHISASLFQGRIGIVVHPLSDTSLGGRIHMWLLASGVRLRAQRTGGARAA